MGVFDDKKFENLDWISQATEPIDSKLNEFLGKIPDEIDINYASYVSIIQSDRSGSLSIKDIIQYLNMQYCGGISLSWDDRSALSDCFEFQMPDGEVIIDFKQGEIKKGSLKIVKTQNTLDEKVLEGMLGKEGIHSLNYIRVNLLRANEVMELLGKCDSGIRSRSPRNKVYAIRARLNDIFKTNEWKIKDTELANKVGFWIKDYIQDGDLAAFSNFCRLKVMTHKDQPIYSMEEV
jgi:hypothetical protein